MLVLCIPAVVCFLFLIFLLSLWQNVSPHMTYSAPSSGTQFPGLCWVHWEASVLLTFPQTLPWLWESPLTATHWTQHCSRQAVTLSFNVTPGNLLPFLCSIQIKGTEKPKGHLERSHLDLWLGLLLMGYHVRGKGREGKIRRRKERVVFKTKCRWIDTGKPCRKVFTVGH